MTDKELLELSAKAMNYKYMNGALWDGRDVIDYGWNPLEDDGQALRLAVKLEMDINIYIGISIVGIDGETYKEYGDDRYSATRRAIVRAAVGLEGARND